MKFAIYGAAGMIGSRLVHEALSRGHEVTALVRTLGKLKLSHASLREVQANAENPVDVAAKVAGHDAAISAISARDARGPAVIVDAAKAMILGCRQAKVLRLLWVGGAGSLETAPGHLLLDSPLFPKEYLGEARAQYEALKIFRTETELEWTYASPAALIAPGERKGKFKLGGDSLVVDAKGESRISAEDFAFAVIYQAEKRGKIRQRFTVAYQET